MFFGKKNETESKAYGERALDEIEAELKTLDEERMPFYTWGIHNNSQDQTSDQTIIEAGIKAAQYIQPFHLMDDDERDDLPRNVEGVTMNRQLGLLYMEAIEDNIIMKIWEKRREKAIIKLFLFKLDPPLDVRDVIYYETLIQDYWRTIEHIRSGRREIIAKIKAAIADQKNF